MRFAVAGAAASAASRGERICALAGAQHEVRASGCCGHCQLGPAVRLQGRPGVPPTTQVEPLLQRAGAVMRAPTQAQARGLEVRLLRRLPAEPARLRGRAARARRARSRSPTSSRPRARTRRRAPTTSRWSRARSPRPTTRERIQRGARRSRGGWSRSAPAPPPAASRRCATSPTSRSSCRSSTPRPSTSRRSPPPRRSPTTCTVDFELQRLPDRQAPAAGGDQRLPRRAPAGDPAHSVCMECKRRGNVCVMVAHGTPCLGPVTHAGCGALCPSYDRGCYGCFGPMETPNTAVAEPAGSSASAPTSADLVRALPHLQRRTRPAVPRGERGHER